MRRYMVSYIVYMMMSLNVHTMKLFTLCMMMALNVYTMMCLTLCI